MVLYMTLPNRDPLQDPVLYISRTSLRPLAKTAILDSIWGDPGPLFDKTRPSIMLYFEYFESQCRLCLQRWGQYNISALRIFHVTLISKMILQGRTREDIESSLALEWRREKDCLTIISEVIDLSIRLLLMVPIWSFWQGVNPDQTSLTWVDGTLQVAFFRHFRKVGREKSRTVEFGKEFIGMNIEREARMRIVWTDNLLDHLLVVDGEFRDVRIFHHASFLHYQQDNDIYPPGLLSETLKTLSLLFPSDNRESNEWVVRPISQHRLDPHMMRQKPLPKEEQTIHNFDYWRDRLIILKHFYDDMAPGKAKSSIRKIQRRLSRLTSGKQ